VDPLLVFHTVRHLRASQIAARLRRMLLRPSVRFRSGASWTLRAPGAGVPPAAPPPDRCDGEVFDLLHQPRRLSGPDRWQPPGVSPLWAYHLHYFQYLDAVPQRRAVELMLDWITANPVGSTPGWDPYPISLRLRVWLEWLASHAADLPPDTRSRLLESLGWQTEYLRQSLEFHAQANHLWENAVSLTWAGLRLAGPSADRWLDTGYRLLRRVLAEQLLGDGLHEERSPAYHAGLCHGVLRLARVARVVGGSVAAAVADLCDDAAGRMLAALDHLTHPDGRVALLNDCGLDWAPTWEQLNSYAGCDAPRRRERGPRDGAGSQDGTWWLPDAGYYGWRREGMYLVFDAGPIGPDHQPAHGHADALSFELSLRGHRLVTDTGVSTYNAVDDRLYERGTAAHNPVQVNGGDQCELWAAFRCGRRPKVTGHLRGGGADPVRMEGSAAVRTRATGSYRHRREVVVCELGLRFRDDLQCGEGSDLTLRLHLAPGIELRPGSGPGRVSLLRQGEHLAEVWSADLDWDAEETPYHPTFAGGQTRICLQLRTRSKGETRLVWGLDWS
jgi:hypothetical protein